jgi:hypothetical protein
LTGRSASFIASERFAVALICILTTFPARGTAATDPIPSPIVEAVTSTGYRVRVPVGDVRVERGRLFGFDLAEISVPGGTVESPWGEPALPTRTVLLRIPWGVTPVANAVRVGMRDLGTVVPVPASHLLTEDAVRRRATPNAMARALDGPPYRAFGGSSDAGVIARAVPMASRGERLLAVTLRPVTWNAASRLARTSDEIAIEVSWERPVPASAGDERFAPPGFSPSGAMGPRYPRRTAFGTASESIGPIAARGPGRAPSFGSARAATGPLRVDLSRPWAKLTVTRPGLYRITAADLAAAGIATNGIDPATFRIFRSPPGDLPESVSVDQAPDSLREIAIDVTGAGDGSFDSGDVLRFYATGETGFGYDLRAQGGVEYQESQRTETQPMWLTWGPGPLATPPRRIATRDATPSPLTPLHTWVTHRVHFEENIYADYDLFQAPLRWERWFRDLIVSVRSTERRRYVITLPGAMPDGASSLRVRMWGASSSIGTAVPDHVARVYWNGALADTAGWTFEDARDLTADSLATHGPRDTVEVEVPFLRDPADTNRVDRQYLAWIEASYPRLLTATNDTLQFAAPDSLVAGRLRYAIGGVSDSSAAWLLDRTDPESPVRLTGGAWSGATAPFSLAAEDSVGPGYRPRYTLASTARAVAPAIALYAPTSSPRTLTNLLDGANAVDYLVVAPPQFLAGAESLATDRAARLQGFASPRTAIATTDRIYAQLGGGRPDPVAIRNLLAFAAAHWTAAPFYVCLLGDASDDPKNYSRFAAPDWVPTQGNRWDPVVGQFITDDFYAFLDGPSDQVFDVAVGRLPAHDPGDAIALAGGKRITYERTADFDIWRARALLTADDGWKWSIKATQRDPVGAEHVTQMERKDNFHLPFPVRREKVYLNDYAFADSTKTSKPGAREAFINAVNSGSWLVDFIGHGNEVLLADEQVFRATDQGRLTNRTRPSIWGFFSCTVGKFDDHVVEGLGESLLRLPNGGAAATLAASQETFGNESTMLNDALVDEVFPLWSDSARVDTVRTAGFAWARAKSAPQNQNIVARKYSFLGDPALVPPLPRGRGKLDKAPLDSLPRGELAAIDGYALNQDGTRDTVSTGTVQVEVLGPRSRRLEQAINQGNEIIVPYFLPGPVLFRGETTLDRGAFTLRFVVPTDGRIVGRGQIRALLSAAGGEGVGLAADSLIVSAQLSSRVDGTPPTIRMLGAAGADSSLAPGSLVTFEIEDSSGIDLTRFDNAHGIFVIVDDRGTPYDLTATFRYAPSSYTRGTATFTLPSLANGAHLLEVHASDTFRNVGVARFAIDVAHTATPGTALTMTEVFNYPNPFPRETYLHARLNQPARLRIQVHTVAGRLVRDFEVDGKAGENYVPWDGRDSRGENVSIGVYLVKLTADASGGSRVTAVARALRTE